MVNYPIYVSLANQEILVVGGGKIATRKVLGLLDQGANITVVAPELSPKLLAIPTIQLSEREYRSTDLENKFMVFICTNNQAVNDRIFSDCSKEQLVNDCTNKGRSNFYNMATIQEGDLQIAISSKGENPRLVKQVKEEIISYFTEYDYY